MFKRLRKVIRKPHQAKPPQLRCCDTTMVIWCRYRLNDSCIDEYRYRYCHK